ncbi:hypothetical protein BZA05DRAFT_439663 [Tricharina praecox]|uniref:uncharacterized protein n=1 Tax=Tricharina praecox TaxID=43433 RepID=UPI0022200FE8|nr:uncharacterized protein BZA05DRAFT_439663 [Tricharina praecox]KAI5842017.1 hypothetical protein BZA05DRAFT_439663 [Tricharina praecox]
MTLSPASRKRGSREDANGSKTLRNATSPKRPRHCSIPIDRAVPTGNKDLLAYLNKLQTDADAMNETMRNLLVMATDNDIATAVGGLGTIKCAMGELAKNAQAIAALAPATKASDSSATPTVAPAISTGATAAAAATSTSSATSTDAFSSPPLSGTHATAEPDSSPQQHSEPPIATAGSTTNTGGTASTNASNHTTPTDSAPLPAATESATSGTPAGTIPLGFKTRRGKSPESPSRKQKTARPPSPAANKTGAGVKKRRGTSPVPPSKKRKSPTSDTSAGIIPLGFKKRRGASPESPSKKQKTAEPPSPAANMTGAGVFSPPSNKRVPVVPQTPSKKRKTTPSFGAEAPQFTTPTAPATAKRRLSTVNEENRNVRICDTSKRMKRAHRAGSERPAAGMKRGFDEGDDAECAVYREDVGMKRPRTGYFQEGDPPMEYETWSDDEDEQEPEELNKAPEQEEEEVL